MGKQEYIQKNNTVQKKVSTIIIAVALLFGIGYLYETNKVAVQGYAIRGIENDLNKLRQENNQLQIKEAELKSLYRIEESGKRLNMFEPLKVGYIDESRPIALQYK